MRRRTLSLAAAFTFLAGATPALAQTWAVEDPVLRNIWNVGTNQSQVMRIAQTLLDSIGPRLTGTPGYDRAADWAVQTLNGWGVDARKEQYGTWNGWRRGITHIDLISPRVRSLEGTMLAWSPGTGGEPVEAEVAVLPEMSFSGQWRTFLATVEGKWVMLSFPQPTCRPDEQWVESALDDTALRMTQERLQATMVTSLPARSTWAWPVGRWNWLRPTLAHMLVTLAIR